MTLESVAADIKAAGGAAELAVVDALDELTHLVVTNIEAARATLLERGVDVGEIRYLEARGWMTWSRPGAPQLQLVR